MNNRFFMNGAGWAMSGTKTAMIIAAVLFVLPRFSDVHSQAMSGNYIIGPDGDYSTFSTAINDMMSRQVGGEILFEVESGIYDDRAALGWIQNPDNIVNTHLITFRSKSGNPEDVVLRAGGGTSPNYIITMHNNLRRVAFENFTIESTSSGTRLIEHRGDNISYRGMIFRGGPIEGAYYSRGLIVEQCTFYNSSLQLVASGSMGNIRIENNTFYSGRITLNHARLAPLIIANNIIYSTQDAIYIRDNRTPLHIFNNYIRIEGNSNRNGIWLHEVDSVLVYHNTVKTIGHGTAFWSTDRGNAHLTNNILYSTLGRVMDIRDPELSSITADYNGYYSEGINVARTGGVNYASWEDFSVVFDQGSNSVYGHPRFSPHDAEEYEPMVPASLLYATAGTDLSEWLPEDLMGNPRPATPSLGALEFIGTDTSIPQPRGSGLPGSFLLAHNYPNPFNPVTTIRYNLPEPAEITVAVYDIHGRHIATLVSDRQEAGSHSAIFNATNLASGVYVYRITANTQTRSGKMLLVK
ncbi:MAG: T9SS C-terminal target domain-containing protein [Balneolaceae bacterium]|nr:MAG: T9SS C-terminal target domain-containing protein [Balneolaceae bacterium]